MALRACRECTGVVSSTADRCPHCGTNHPAIPRSRLRANAFANGLSSVVGWIVVAGIGLAIVGWVNSPERKKEAETVAAHARTAPPEVDNPVTIRKKALVDAAMYRTRGCLRESLNAFTRMGVRDRDQLLLNSKAMCKVAIYSIFGEVGELPSAETALNLLAEFELNSLLGGD